MEELKIGNYCKYKGRIVRVLNIDRKVNRIEVIIGKWNPFWVNGSALKRIEAENKMK